MEGASFGNKNKKSPQEKYNKIEEIEKSAEKAKKGSTEAAFLSGMSEKLFDEDSVIKDIEKEPLPADRESAKKFIKFLISIENKIKKTENIESLRLQKSVSIRYYESLKFVENKKEIEEIQDILNNTKTLSELISKGKDRLLLSINKIFNNLRGDRDIIKNPRLLGLKFIIDSKTIIDEKQEMKDLNKDQIFIPAIDDFSGDGLLSVNKGTSEAASVFDVMGKGEYAFYFKTLTKKMLMMLENDQNISRAEGRKMISLILNEIDPETFVTHLRAEVSLVTENGEKRKKVSLENDGNPPLLVFEPSVTPGNPGSFRTVNVSSDQRGMPFVLGDNDYKDPVVLPETFSTSAQIFLFSDGVTDILDPKDRNKDREQNFEEIKKAFIEYQMKNPGARFVDFYKRIIKENKVILTDDTTLYEVGKDLR